LTVCMPLSDTVKTARQDREVIARWTKGVSKMEAAEGAGIKLAGVVKALRCEAVYMAISACSARSCASSSSSSSCR
jgi:hypothetical protein